MPRPPADDAFGATTTNTPQTEATPGSATVGFKSASAYFHFARRVVRSHRYVLDEESHEFLSTLREQAQSRRQKIPAGAIFWRAQLGHDWRPLMEGKEHIDDIPCALPPDRM